MGSWVTSITDKHLKLWLRKSVFTQIWFGSWLTNVHVLTWDFSQITQNCKSSCNGACYYAYIMTWFELWAHCLSTTQEIQHCDSNTSLDNRMRSCRHQHTLLTANLDVMMGERGSFILLCSNCLKNSECGVWFSKGWMELAYVFIWKQFWPSLSPLKGCGLLSIHLSSIHLSIYPSFQGGSQYDKHETNF